MIFWREYKDLGNNYRNNGVEFTFYRIMNKILVLKHKEKNAMLDIY